MMILIYAAIGVVVLTMGAMILSFIGIFAQGLNMFGRRGVDRR